MWLYHELLIHFPVDGNLDHFQFFCYYKYTVHIIVNFLWMYAFVILSILQGRELLTNKQGIQPPWCAWNYHLHFSEESPTSLEALQFSSVQLLSRVWLFGTPWTPWTPCPSPTPGVYWNSRPLSRWCHPTISSSVIPVSSCLQYFSASGSIPVSQFFASGGHNIGVSASASVLPMNIQDWFPLGWTGWISMQSKGLSRVFSNTTVQKHQFFSAQLSL